MALLTPGINLFMTDIVKWIEEGEWVCILNFSTVDKEEFIAFQAGVLKLCESTQNHMAIDLQGVDYLNSIKIGFLVKLHKLLYPVKRKFAVYNSSDNLYDMAVSINLEEVIPFHRSIDKLKD